MLYYRKFRYRRKADLYENSLFRHRRRRLGSVIPVTQIAAAGEISAALDKRCAVLVPGVGAVVCGKDEDDTQALAVLADKAAVCALHTAALGQRAQLSRADIALQHLVYQQKYAKQKEAGK